MCLTPVERGRAEQSADSDSDDDFIRFFANHIVNSSEPESNSSITVSPDINSIPEHTDDDTDSMPDLVMVSEDEHENNWDPTPRGIHVISRYIDDPTEWIQEPTDRTPSESGQVTERIIESIAHTYTDALDRPECACCHSCSPKTVWIWHRKRGSTTLVQMGLLCSNSNVPVSRRQAICLQQPPGLGNVGLTSSSPTASRIILPTPAATESSQLDEYPIFHSSIEEHMCHFHPEVTAADDLTDLDDDEDYHRHYHHHHELIPYAMCVTIVFHE